MSLYVREYVSMCQTPTEAKRGAGTTGIRVISNCEVANIGAGNRT